MSTLPPPPPVTKYRPSAGWFVGGIVLILAAVAVGVGAFVWLLAGFFSTNATVSADGRPHQVSVSTDGDRMLWLEEDETSCEILDLDTGDPVELRTVGGNLERSDSQGEFEGLYRFSPGSGELEVTCVSAFSDLGPTPLVLIGPMPEIDNIVIGLVVMLLVPGVLGLAGLVMLIWTGILWSVRDPRPKGA